MKKHLPHIIQVVAICSAFFGAQAVLAAPFMNHWRGTPDIARALEKSPSIQFWVLEYGRS